MTQIIVENLEVRCWVKVCYTQKNGFFTPRNIYFYVITFIYVKQKRKTNIEPLFLCFYRQKKMIKRSKKHTSKVEKTQQRMMYVGTIEFYLLIFFLYAHIRYVGRCNIRKPCIITHSHTSIVKFVVVTRKEWTGICKANNWKAIKWKNFICSFFPLPCCFPVLLFLYFYFILIFLVFFSASQILLLFTCFFFLFSIFQKPF